MTLKLGETIADHLLDRDLEPVHLLADLGDLGVPVRSLVVRVHRPLLQEEKVEAEDGPTLLHVAHTEDGQGLDPAHTHLYPAEVRGEGLQVMNAEELLVGNVVGVATAEVIVDRRALIQLDLAVHVQDPGHRGHEAILVPILLYLREEELPVHAVGRGVQSIVKIAGHVVRLQGVTETTDQKYRLVSCSLNPCITLMSLTINCSLSI